MGGGFIPIQGNFKIYGQPVLAVKYQSNKACEALYKIDISLGKIYNLLLFLEDDIVTIQDLDIIDYTNQEIVEKANKNIRTYFRKFEKFYGPLEDNLDVV